MENKDNTKVDIVSKIKELKLIDCMIEDSMPTKAGKELDKDKVQFEFNIAMNLNSSEKIMTINLNTKIFADLTKTISLGHISTLGKFEIVNLSDILDTFNKKIPDIIIANFIGVIIGTTRGFLVSQTEDTILEGIYIPMISPASFFPSLGKQE